MAKPIDLNELIEQMDMQFEEYRTFFNKENGVLFTVSADKLRDVEAFRRFKDLIQRYGIADDWYKYRDNRYRGIAIQWCEENDIKYK